MAVPKAAMNEDDLPAASEHEVGFPGQRSRVLAIAVSKSMH
jgi:hypothetical protein